MDAHKDKYNLSDLTQLMARLRSPDNGCPWDIEQTFQTIKPHTIEEAFEVADAIERNDMNDLKDELGDLLFQVIFHAQMAAEQNAFTIDDIIDHVTKKMIFRHPHVFGDDVAKTADDVKNDIWEQQKAKEKDNNKQEHYLDDVTRALPSLLLANKIQERVRKIGFKYPTLHAVLDKLDEEIKELKSAVESGNQDDITEEFGDVLFVTALLGEHVNAPPEETLRAGCLKFIARFNKMEDLLKSNNNPLKDATIEDMTQAWLTIKDDTQKP